MQLHEKSYQFVYSICIITGDNANGKILDSIATYLRNINMDELLPYLQQHHLVTTNEQYHLRNTKHSQLEKSQILLGYLKQKGDGSLQMFLCSLNLAHEHIGHKNIVKKLKQKMKAKGIECKDFCSDECKHTD